MAHPPLSSLRETGKKGRPDLPDDFPDCHWESFCPKSVAAPLQAGFLPQIERSSPISSHCATRFLSVSVHNPRGLVSEVSCGERALDRDKQARLLLCTDFCSPRAVHPSDCALNYAVITARVM
ncbi:unnamed protein product [Natator depressus]